VSWSFRVDKDVAMPMRDETVLRGDVWRCDDDQARPVLLQRTPYRKESTDASWFAEAVGAGYTVVVQDVRGRFASDGVWGGFTTEMWAAEGRDSYDTVEWIADQPWCDGAVGMFGQSYVAAVALLGAAAQPPHLKAIAPAKMGSHELAHLDTGGAFWLRAWLHLPLAMLAADLPRRIERGELTADKAAEVTAAIDYFETVLDFLPLQDWPYFDVPSMPAPLKHVLSGEAPGPPMRFDLTRITVPTLVIGGWFDFYVARTVDQFRQLRQHSGGGPATRQSHQLLLGPWQHGPELPEQGELNFGPEAAGPTTLLPAQLAFFNRHLKNKPVDLPPVRYFLMGANQWRTADHWPPTGVQTHLWYLHASGGFSRTAPTDEEPPDRYHYDPTDPTPSTGGRSSPLGGPRDLSRLTARSDVLCYTSGPVPEPIDLIGHVTARLFAATTAVDTDFVVRLADVHPDGRALYIASGLCRARYRHGVDRETLLTPGAVEGYEINLGPTAVRVPQGHRLAVYVCSSDFPWFDRNMNTGNPIGVDIEPIIANQTIYHDPARPSRLEVQVCPQR
jgi:uncharacterized protein